MVSAVFHSPSEVDDAVPATAASPAQIAPAPVQKAAPAFLKGVASDPSLQLHDLATGVSYSAADSDVVRMVYFSHLRPACVCETENRRG